jgi:hypothetical protein
MAIAEPLQPGVTGLHWLVVNHQDELRLYEAPRRADPGLQPAPGRRLVRGEVGREGGEASSAEKHHSEGRVSD